MNPAGYGPPPPGIAPPRPPQQPTPVAAMQPCARCGTQWPVQGVPVQWCPRCRGPLLSAATVDASPWRRNYRWVVRTPRPRGPGPAVATRPTPAYGYIPRWGFTDVPRPAAGPQRAPLARLAASAPKLLLVTAGAFVLAALAEGFRYGLLLWNRSRLADQWVVRLSDWLVVSASILAPLLALLTAVSAVAWLAERRSTVFAARGQADPHPFWLLAAGCWIPLINLVVPGVFLLEIADRTQRRAVRIWWCAWVFGAVMVCGALLFRTARWLPGTIGHAAHSLQFKANGVLFMAETNLAAAGVALASLWLLRTLDGRDIRGHRQLPKRWLIATGPARPVIAEVSGEQHPAPLASGARTEVPASAAA